MQAYNYIFVENKQVVRAYGISFLVTAVGTSISLVITTLLAYSISRRAPARGIMTFFVFFTLLFNGGLVPSYINYVNVLHIKDTFWALIVPLPDAPTAQCFADEIVFRHKHTGRTS